MKLRSTISFIALLICACVHKTPEPGPSGPAAADCPHGYLSIRPGQNVQDPSSAELPDYIDIVGIEASLAGETLTATIYLRGIPQELTIGREGVDPGTIEYMWIVEIDVDTIPEDDLDEYHAPPLDYALGSLSLFGIPISETETGMRPFAHALRTEVWRYDYNDDDNFIEMNQVNAASLEVSHEDNSLTFIGDVPSITPHSHLYFWTFDFLSGQDGVSCSPE